MDPRREVDPVTDKKPSAEYRDHKYYEAERDHCVQDPLWAHEEIMRLRNALQDARAQLRAATERGFL